MKKYLYKDLYNLEDKHWWHIAKRKAVLSFIYKYSPPKQMRILDMGCGTGKNLETLNKIGSAYGIDSSLQAIKFCKRRGLTNLSIEKADKTKLPEGSFDLITALDVLEHTDDSKTLKEIRRILRRNGLVIITVPALPLLWSKWDDVLHHKRRYTKKSLKKALENNNFQTLQISYMNSFLVVPVLLVRIIKSIIFRKNYPSDFLLSPPFVNQILFLLSKLESIFIERGLVPIGLSLIAVAKKSGKNYT